MIWEVGQDCRTEEVQHGGTVHVRHAPKVTIEPPCGNTERAQREF